MIRRAAINVGWILIFFTALATSILLISALIQYGRKGFIYLSALTGRLTGYWHMLAVISWAIAPPVIFLAVCFYFSEDERVARRHRNEIRLEKKKAEGNASV